jgi:hypothetical protein
MAPEKHPNRKEVPATAAYSCSRITSRTPASRSMRASW